MPNRRKRKKDRNAHVNGDGKAHSQYRPTANDRAKWIADTYKLPLSGVIIDLMLGEISGGGCPVYVERHMFKRTREEAISLNRVGDKLLAAKLLNSKDPRVQAAVDRIIAAAEEKHKDLPTYHPPQTTEDPRRNEREVWEVSRAHVVGEGELRAETDNPPFSIAPSKLEMVRVTCKACKKIFDVPIEEASRLFLSTHCPLCPQAKFDQRSLESNPFELLARAVRRFAQLKHKYTVEFFIANPDEP